MATILTSLLNTRLIGYSTCIFGNKEKYHQHRLKYIPVLPVDLLRIIYSHLESEIIAYYFDGHIDIYDITTMEFISRITTQVSYDYTFKFSSDGSMIFVINKNDHEIILNIYDVLSGELLFSHNLTSELENIIRVFVNKIVCSIDNKRIYIIFYNQSNFSLYCINISTGEIIFRNVFTGVKELYLSPNNKYLCLYQLNTQRYEILNALSGDVIHNFVSSPDRFDEFTDFSYMVEFSMDGEHLIIANFTEDDWDNDRPYYNMIDFQQNLIAPVEKESLRSRYYSNQDNVFSEERQMYTIQYYSRIEFNLWNNNIIKIDGRSEYLDVYDGINCEYSHSRKYMIRHNICSNKIIIYKINL
jgi:hypothetical protein